MKLTGALSLISDVGIYCSTGFYNTSGSTLTVKKNILAKTISLTTGINKIGFNYPYNMQYVMYGNDITLRNTTTWNGNVYYSNTINKDSTYVNKNFTTLIRPSNDFSEITKNIKGVSDYLFTLEGNTKFIKTSSSLTISGSNNYLNVINFNDTTIDDFNDVNNYYLEVPKDSFVVFNINSTTPINLYNKIFEYGAISRENVFINTNSTSVNVIGEFEPSILAISSIINLNNSTTYGQIISDKIYVSGINYIYYSPFLYNELIPEKIEDNVILCDISDLDAIATVTIYNEDLDTTIWYSYDGVSFVEYVSPIVISRVGEIKIYSYSSKYGYYDSNTIFESFYLTCTCSKPSISVINNVVTLTSNTTTSNIYYTLDGTIPTTDSDFVINGNSFTLKYEGKYEINAFTVNGKCADSGVESKTVYIKLPRPEITINILTNKDTNGVYFDDNGKGVEVEILSSIPGTTIYYTEDGLDPMTYGSKYKTHFFTKSRKIMAVAFGENVGYSSITETPLINIGGQLYVNKSELLINSENKADEFSPYSVYGQDMGWYGPTILVDDNAVYQSLVGILSTNLLEIPFRPDFGTSLKSYIFKNTQLMTSQEIISKLKGEIELNDPRIYIDTVNSFAYFDADSNQIIINLSWRNNNTGEMAMLKYGFNLDGIL